MGGVGHSMLAGVQDFDRLATFDSPLHRRDPRAKVIVALLAAVVAVSYSKYAVSAMLPLLVLPFFWLMQSGTPLRFYLHNLRVALPFVFFVAIFNPWFDRTPMTQVLGIGISGGWVSFASIMLRFVVSMSVIIVLVASTGFNTLCAALLKLGLPKVLVVQLLLLYRYIFLLGEEAQRIRNAYALRSLSDKGIELKVVGSMLGQLLLRVVGRGQRIHQAMLCRGFTGDIPVRHAFRWRTGDTVFVLGWAAWLLLVRFVDLPHVLGRLVLGA